MGNECVPAALRDQPLLDDLRGLCVEESLIFLVFLKIFEYFSGIYEEDDILLWPLEDVPLMALVFEQDEFEDGFAPLLLLLLED